MYHPRMHSEANISSWMDGIKKGRPEAFEAFLGQYWNALSRLVMQFNISAHDREEWVELILLHAIDRIIKGKVRYISKAKFNSWLYQVARFKCLELWRRANRNREVLMENKNLDMRVDPRAECPADACVIEDLRRKLAAIFHPVPT